MKILGIKGKNLASLKGEFNIEFDKEPLASAGIFAITGPTGAGKSTILDAMCLALFGQTPRFNTPSAKEIGIKLKDGDSSITQGDVKNILRKGASEGYAEVKFLAQDNVIYLSRWTTRRAKNSPTGALQADSIELRNFNTGEPFADKKTETKVEIVRLIGFTFDQFTRSVLLAQNDFTAFLKAKIDERSLLLEKLTGTEIYSKISKKLFDKTKELGQQVENIRVYLREVKLLENQQLTAYQEELSSLLTQIKLFETQDKQYKKELDWYENLQKLQTEISEAEASFFSHQALIQTTNTRRQNWQLVEAVQDVRSLFETNDRLQEVLEERKKEIDTIVLDKNRLTSNRQKEQEQLDNTKIASDEFEKYIQENTVFIKRAEALDVELSSLQKQLQATEIEFKEAETNKTLAAQAHKNASDQRKILEQEISEAQHYLTKHKDREEIAKNAVLITQKLKDAQAATDEIRQNKEEIDRLEISTEQNLFTLKTNQSTVLEHADYLASITAEIDKINKELALIDLKSVKESLENSLVETNRIQSAKNCFEELRTAETNYQNITDQATQLTEKIASLKDESIKQKEITHILKIKKEEAEKAYQTARLASSENIISLRSQLVPNEPCIVCGSTSHPYIQENQQLNHVLDKLSTNRQMLEAEYDQSNNQLLSALNQINSSQELLENYQKDQIKAENIQNEKNGLWIQHQQQLAVNPSDTSIESQLDELLNAQIKQTQVLKEKESNHERVQAKLYQQKEIQLQKEKQLSKLNSENSSLETQIGIEKVKLAQLYDSNERANKTISQAIDTISNYFGKKDWIKNWENDPNSFTSKISSFAQEWNINEQKFNISSKERNTIDGSIEALLESAKYKALNSQKMLDKLTNIQKDLQKLTTERKTIFEGKDITLVLQTWETQKTTLKSKLDQINDNIHKLNLEEQRQTTSLEKIQEIISNLTNELSLNTKTIQDWRQNFNQQQQLQFSVQDIVGLLSYASQWRGAESTFFKELDNQLLRLQSTLDERNNQLNTHQSNFKPSSTKEEIALLFQKNTEDYNQANDKSQEINYYLKSDQEARSKSTSYLKQLEELATIYENHKKLNELFGSSDGKKFSRMAQEYTLEILVTYANSHLKDLSQRYQLERIEDTLALQVIDMDMGDEIRSVHTLSGGESFIVSLALALGLASLSSNRMSVESLFIDEGFGSLDADTLRVAIDVLERLHAQGRKVGVISHIPEMTERIQTQINVVRISEGTSKVEVPSMGGYL